MGSASANELAAEADVVLAVGTRLQDFTTGSWTLFADDARFIGINAARFDARKHLALPVVGDAAGGARRAAAGARRLAGARGLGRSRASELYAEWNGSIDQRSGPTNAELPTYAHVVGAVNRLCRRARPGADRGRRHAGRAVHVLAGQAARHLRLRVRLLLHGLRDRRRLGCQDGRPVARRVRHGRRRQLPDDELRHLSLGADRPEADRRRLRQWRLCRHRPAAARQGHPVLQQPARRHAASRASWSGSISPSTPKPWVRSA